jgi:dephospho-CoA kinase
MITAGLTGGIASGKSTVCSVFESLGAAIVDADIIAREIVSPGEDGWKSLVNCFGNMILLPDGNIDREKLGRKIFSDKTARAELDSCLHPLIISKLMSEIKNIKIKAENQVIIADVPLLIECEIQDDFDRVILVYADRKTQVKRLIKRNNITVTEAEERVGSQLDIESKRKFAHIIIENSSSLRDLKNSVNNIYLKLVGS